MNPESDEDITTSQSGEDDIDDEEAFELIEYFENSEQPPLVVSDNNIPREEVDELSTNGCYFICLDVVQNKITGYYKQAFLKNCQKLIIEGKP